MKKIQRFPRLAKDYPEMAKKQMYLGVNVTNGRVPRGYDRLTKRQKKAIRLVINGMTLRDMGHKLGIHMNTWYRWLNVNKRFKEYYLKYARRQAETVEMRLDAKAGRAVRVIEDALDSPDPYFSADQAVKYLSGRGHYKKNVESKQTHTHSGAILHGVTGGIKHEMLPKELMTAFVEALTGRAIGPPEKKEKTISAKVLKELPETVTNGIPAEIQEGVKAEAV